MLFRSELPAAIDRMQAESKELRRAVKSMQEALATHEAARLVAEAPVVSGVRIIARALSGWDAPGLKAIAVAATASERVAAALFSTASPVVAVIARSRDVKADAYSVLRALVGEFGGRGGGKADLAQGGGFEGDVNRMVAMAHAALQDQATIDTVA